MTDLVDVAARGGGVTRRAQQHLHELANVLGLEPSAIQLFVSKRLRQE